jgi:outer membrane biosynthesis protein TonB
LRCALVVLRIVPCVLAVTACAGGSGAPVAAPVASAQASASASSAARAEGSVADAGEQPNGPQAAPPSATIEPAASPPCADSCAGSATPELVAAATSRAGQAKPCYDRALGAGGSVRGRMRVLVRVRDDGSVCETRVLASDMSTEMNRCVTQVLGGASYPAPVGGCIDVTVPLTFEPRAADAGP